ncbi:MULTISPECIES: mismatch-specific DNA-glycosylase [Metabacillus]|uniref:Mismatch-specific DNA-glycosylase n=3 Tax=Metabacillus TaxID=2675233 RepID=A0A179SWJ6_9BACI|nr:MULTISPECIES: mismatch-specific DNA-glycosylase [Metabacillus]OAS86127.1 mismatch-specific DNA-glycosylase [Metabacillus litoralis]QNF30539.1 mismatch-specific DNA-glycosylase [Metabacillus sp. KUDC1714]
MLDKMDHIKQDLRILFIGFNPSLVSGEVGHHYANKHNRFWKILYEAGITVRQYKPEEDFTLLNNGIGFTNIVSRPSRAAEEITSEEYKVGRIILRQKIDEYKPKIAFFVGKGVYLQYSQRKKADWGKQEHSIVEGVIDFVAPSSSGLVRMRIDDIISIYKDVTKYCQC